MDVSISGVKGYEFQYKISVFLTLTLLLKFDLEEVKIEPNGGEDILFILKNDKENQIIEVQVKRENDHLDETKLLKWLLHFEPRKHDSCLLTRLINSKKRVLFVTKSRCSMNNSKLITKLTNYLQKPNIDFSKQEISDYHKIITSKKFYSGTKLGNKRNEFIESNIAPKLNDEIIFNSIFNRIDIIEQFEEESLNYEILRILNSEYGIPVSQTLTVYQLCLEAVKNSRDSNSNLIHEVVPKIEQYKGNTPNLSPNYVEREIEPVLEKILIQTNSLKLTGISFCGKSEIAKKIASEFTKRGHSYRITSDIHNAESFLFGQNIDDEKILILEDPFGHINPISNSYEVSHLLKQLLERLRSNQKIIVTSQFQILKQVYGKKQIENDNWINLTTTEVEQAISFWEEISKKKGSSAFLIKKVKQVINLNNSDILQIGQIEYLSRQDEAIILDKTIHELDAIARYDAKNIGREMYMNHRKAGELLYILSFCGNTLNGINQNHLSFILSKDNRSYTVFKNAFSKLKFDNNGSKISFNYNKKYKLKKSLKKNLEYLEERGFIFINGANIRFLHSNYSEAGNQIAFNLPETKQLALMKTIKRAINCFDSDIAYFASNQLINFYRNTEFDGIKKKLIKIGFWGINSIFPSIIDNCLLFLITIFEELSLNKQSELIRIISYQNNNIYSLKWHRNSVPYLNRNSNLFNEEYSNFDEETAIKIESRLKIKEEVSAKEASDYLVIRSLKNGLIENLVFESLMAFRESFIRERAAKLYFLIEPKNLNTQLLESIFKDPHPLVVFKGLRSCIESWYKFNPQQKQLLSKLLKLALKRRDVAIRASNLMTTFGTDYASESINWRNIPEAYHKEIWQLWHRLYLIYHENVPNSVSLHTPRFTGTMDDAMKYLNKKDYLDILNCWFDRLDKKIKRQRIPDDHEFSLMLNLIESTGKDHKAREKLFNDLIFYNDTNFALSSLKWALSYWELLGDVEKIKIEQLADSRRKDIRWIHAVIINAYYVPSSLQMKLFGEENFLAQDIKFILENIQTQLLSDALCVYYGKPQPLYWLALHGKKTKFWDEIIYQILSNRISPYYEQCLVEFLFDAVNGFGAEANENFELWEIICTKSEDLKLETELLIYATASCTCNIPSAKKTWKTLKKAYKSKNKQDMFIQRLLDNIVLLQNSERLDLHRIIEAKILEKVFHCSDPDIKILSIIEKMTTEGETEELSDELNKFIDNLNEKYFMRFYITFKIIDKILLTTSLSENIIKKLKTLPNLIDVIGGQLLEEIDQKRNYKLKNWIGQN